MQTIRWSQTAFLSACYLLLSYLECGLLAAATEDSAWTPYRNIETTSRSADLEGARAHQPITDSDLETLRIASAVSPYYSSDLGYPSMAHPIDPSLEQVCPPMVAGTCSPEGFTPEMCVPMVLNGAGHPGAAIAPHAWQWHVLPADIIYHSYLAGVHEPRISGVIFHDLNGSSTYIDASLGGRVGIVRYGTPDRPDGLRPHGWELDIEGAAFPRLNLNENWDIEAVDFRVGFPLTYGQDKWQAKFSYYHLSSHMGDEYALRENINLTTERINFSRDTLVLGGAFFPRPAWRWYAETGWAFYYDGGTKPWEFQFGIEYAQPGPTGRSGTPFLAINGHLRQEVDYGGNMVFQAGWLWQGKNDNRLRLGFHYFNGKSNQFQFFNEFEQQLGGGIWYEF